MIREGENRLDDISFTVVRRKAKRIILRVKADGSVWLTVPRRGATLREAEAFLLSRREWILRAMERAKARPQPSDREWTPMELARLQTLIGGLHAQWAARLGEHGVEWKLRRMKTRWGVCNWKKRKITYSVMLADKPRECVEYVVVHEFTHFLVHNHGPSFKALMDARLPGWRELRRRLNGRAVNQES